MREKDYIMEEVTYNHKLPARILHQKVTGPDCYVPLHWHREIELNLMLKGNTEFKVNGIPHRTMEGELILINSGVLHLRCPAGQGPDRPECGYHRRRSGGLRGGL